MVDKLAYKLLRPDNPYCSDSLKVGGKAAGLFIIATCGLHIPETIIIPISQDIDQGVLRELEAFLSEVLQTHSNNATFAVRSSSLAEDGHSRSYAGMFNTILHLSAELVPDAIRKCVRQTTSRHLTAYHSLKEGGAELNGNIGIIVQRMLQAEFAGVAFTSCPLPNMKHLSAIEFVSGTGEILVSGQVTPDLLLVDKDTMSVNYYEPGDQANGSVGLNQEMIKELLNGMKIIQGSLGYEIDVEFAIEKGSVYFLQARPVTTM